MLCGIIKLMNTIQHKLNQAVLALFSISQEVELTRPDYSFGDWTTNVALKITKAVGQPPREIAQQIADYVKHDEAFKSVDIAGPGFINITLKPEVILNSALKDYAVSRQEARVVIETNNPNPFKAMHIGHAFNSILADTVANLLEVQYESVVRVSYHGDVGSHVGKSMYAIMRFCDGDASKLDSIDPEDRKDFMSRMYVEGATSYEQSEEVKAEVNGLAQQSFVLDDKYYREIYEKCKAWSFTGIDEAVSRLGNKPTTKRYLESQADPIGVGVVRANVGPVFFESDGAVIFPGSKYGSFDNTFVSSAGRGLYAARDLGLIKLKSDDFSPVKSYIITAEEQRDYFKGVLAAADLCMPEYKGVTENIIHGTVKLATGKMSSRTGDVVDISWLFEQFKEAIEKRGGVASDEMAAAAMRYQFLKIRIGGDDVFDINEAVSLTGNTGSYIQYAHARARGIIRKSGNSEVSDVEEVLEEDLTLIRKLAEYSEVMESAIVDLQPHRICNYLFELAQEFNRYYEKNMVIGSNEETHRLGIVKLYADRLKSGLKVLGIVAPEEM